MVKIHSTLNYLRMKKVKNHRLKQVLNPFSKSQLPIKGPMTRQMTGRARTSMRRLRDGSASIKSLSNIIIHK